MLLLLTRHGPGQKAPALFFATAIANLLAYFLSPEMGLAFGVAGLAWLAVAHKALSKTQLAAVAIAIVVDIGGLFLFARPMFTTFLAFSSIQIILPVVPHIGMLVVVMCFLTVCAITVSAVMKAWRGELGRDETIVVAQACACAALAVALLPPVIGRTWPTTTLAYGFSSVVMAVGYFAAAGVRRTAMAITVLFGLFAFYNAMFVARDDFGQLRAWVHLYRCELAASAPCPRGRADSPFAIKQAAWERLAPRFPRAYDPLGFIGHGSPHTVDFGYYPGLASVLDEVGIARKTAELQRAAYYILPDREVAERQFSRDRRERVLQNFRRRSLFPFPLHLVRSLRSSQADFVEMLFERCSPIAVDGGITVCRAAGADSH